MENTTSVKGAKGVGKGGHWRARAAMILQAGAKWCAKCKNIKPLHEFSKRKHRLDGHFHLCKQCERTSAYREMHQRAQRKYDKTSKGRATFKRYMKKLPKVQWEILLKNGMKQYVVEKTSGRARSVLRNWGIYSDQIISCIQYVPK